MLKYIDLSLNIEKGMRGFSSEPAFVLRDDGWNGTTFHIYSHCGTHMDAPQHFEVSEETIDKIPVDRFFVDCWIIDITSIEKKGQIKIEHLKDVKNKFRKGEGLVFKSGWSQYMDQDEYRNQLPGISYELALWCAENGVTFVGVEPPSIADVNDIQEVTKIHRIFLENQIIIVEGLTNLDSIKKDKVQIVALPLKIKGADGAPARVIAIEN